MTAHYLRGGTLLRSWLRNPRVDLAAADVQVEYVSVRSSGGNGFALDAGLAWEPHPGVTLSGSVANVYSTMRGRRICGCATSCSTATTSTAANSPGCARAMSRASARSAPRTRYSRRGWTPGYCSAMPRYRP